MSDPREKGSAGMEHPRLVSRLSPGVDLNSECTDPEIICATKAGDSATVESLVPEIPARLEAVITALNEFSSKLES